MRIEEKKYLNDFKLGKIQITKSQSVLVWFIWSLWHHITFNSQSKLLHQDNRKLNYFQWNHLSLRVLLNLRIEN